MDRAAAARPSSDQGESLPAREFLQLHAEPSLVRWILEATEAAKRNTQKTQLAHLVLALLRDPFVAVRLPERAMQEASAKLSDFVLSLPQTTRRPGEIEFGIQSLFQPAIDNTRAMGGERVTPLGFLATAMSSSLLTDEVSVRVQEILRSVGISSEQLGASINSRRKLLSQYVFKGLRLGIDLTAMARDGWWSECPVVGMSDVLENLAMQVSTGRESVVLVGEPGVGKSAVVEGLAFHIARRTRPLIPASLEHASIVMISPMDLKADTGVQGTLEARIKGLLQFFQENRNVIPFFDEIHTLLNTEDASTQGFSTALKPAMARGEFRCIGATTSKEYARFITNDEAMKRRFMQVVVPEPNESQTIAILTGVVTALLDGQAKHMGVRLSPDAIKTAVQMTSRYQRTEYQPAKSINLLRQIITERVYRLVTGRETRQEVEAGDLAAWFSRRTGIPVDALDDTSSHFYAHLRDSLAREVLGQDRAIDDVVAWLALQGAGWLDHSRPRAVFLFLGPSGVGKSELGHQLAEQLMNDRNAIITRSLSDFADQSARSSWQGAAPGYVGFGTTSTVYSEVLVRPYSIVVLDDMERAHESLSGPLVSMFDGMGQDGQGRRVDFSQCIFVLTSNAFRDTSGLSEDEVKERLLRAGGIWHPDLLERIDRVVLFEPLSEDARAAVLSRLIEKRRRSAAKPLPAALESASVRAQILSAGSDRQNGSARPIERALASWLVAYARNAKSAEESIESIARGQS